MAAGAIRAGKAYVELFRDDSMLKRGLRQTKQYLNSWGQGLQRVGAGLFAGGAAVDAGLGLAINMFRQAGAELGHVSAITGISIERLSALQYAAVQCGGSLEDVSHGIQHMSRFLMELRNGDGGALDTMRDLGLDAGELLDLAARDQAAAFMRLGSAIASTGSSWEQDARARQVFARSGAEMMGMLRRLESEFPALSEEAERLGLVMTRADQQGARQLNQSWNRLYAVAGGLANQIGAALAPSLTDLLTMLSNGLGVVVSWVRENRGWIQVLSVTALVVMGLGTAIGFLGTALTVGATVVGAFSAAITAVITVLVFVKAAILGVLTFIAALFSPIGAVAVVAGVLVGIIAVGVGIIVGLLGYMAYVFLRDSGYAAQAWQWLVDTLGPIFEEIKQTFSALFNAIGQGDWGAAMDLITATLSLGWVATINVLKSAWREFRDWFLDMAENMALLSVQKLVKAAVAINGLLPSFMQFNTSGATAFLDTLQNVTTEGQADRRRQRDRDQASDDNDLDEAMEAFLAARDAAANAGPAAWTAGSGSDASPVRPQLGAVAGSFSAVALGGAQGSAASGTEQRLDRVAEAAEAQARTQADIRTLTENLLNLVRAGGTFG